MALSENNPPVNKLTSPLSGGTREFFDIFYSLYHLPPLKGEVPERSEGGGVVVKKKGGGLKGRRGLRTIKNCNPVAQHAEGLANSKLALLKNNPHHRKRST